MAFCSSTRADLQRRLQLGQCGGQFTQLLLIADAQLLRLAQGLTQLREFLALATADLLRVLDGLFGARDLRPDLVVATLYLGEGLAGSRVVQALAFYRRLVGALFGKGCLQRVLPLGVHRLPRTRLAGNLGESQGEQLAGQLALVLLERLVAAGRRGLALQVAQLLVDFLAQVVEPVQVLARVRDAALGLAAAFLVPGDAGGLLEKATHLVGPRVDHARDHVLLDDRVAARAEARAEEQLGDVLAPAAAAVEEIIRGAVAGDHALQRHLGEGRVLAAERPVGVVEYQLHRRRADRLARTGAVEHDVGHRIATQVLCRDLAEYPAHRVDDVGLAAAVGADHADEVAGEVHAGRVHEGLETGQLDLGQAHRTIRAGKFGQIRQFKINAIGSQHRCPAALSWQFVADRLDLRNPVCIIPRPLMTTRST